MSVLSFTIGDDRSIDITVTRAGVVVNLTTEEPDIRFKMSGVWSNVTYSIERDNLTGEDAEGGITVLDGPAGLIRVVWSATETDGFPAVPKGKYIVLVPELELDSDANGIETVELDVTSILAKGQLIVPATP